MVVVEFLAKDAEEATKLKKGEIIAGLTDIGAPSFEDGNKIIVELTPNRPDLFFLEGITRALNYFYGKKRPVRYAASKSSYAMKVEKVGQRPHVAAAVVKNISLDENRLRYIINAQEKIHDTIGRKRKKVAIGLHDADAIKFPVEYKEMQEVKFIPLDFSREMKASEIVSLHSKGKIYGSLIKGGYPIIADSEGVASMPPIINSERTKLTGKTKSIFIDVTGTHKETVEAALNMLSCSLADLGGEICEVKIGKESYPKLEGEVVKLDLGFAKKLLGIELGKKQAEGLLLRMGYETKGNGIIVPPYRADIMHFVDIVEDIAIAYGYNNFESTLPGFFSEGKINESHFPISDCVRSMGFTEIKTFMLTNKASLVKAGYSGALKEMEKPQNEEYAVFRPSLVSNMLDTFLLNKTRGLPQKIYEIGHVYDNGRQAKKTVFAIMGKGINFSEIRGALQTLLKELGIKFELRHAQAYWSDERESGEVVVGGKPIGYVGKVAEKVLQAHGIEFPVYVCEIEL